MATVQKLFLALTSVSLMTGCNGAIWGNLAVLAISVGIFMGTLSLGKHPSRNERKRDQTYK